MSDDDSPGWGAIDAACERVHPGVEPMHWGTIVRWRLGGNDPLDGMSAYPVDDPPHWHYVGYGLTELYEKESDNPDESGWGFELTFRLARSPGESAPIWPASLLQNLARYVFTSGNWFEPGHHIDLNGPVCAGDPTRLTGLVMAEDPELGAIDTPNGRMVFVQCVAVTADELEAVRQWDAAKFLDAMARRDPLFVTDLERGSFLDDQAFAAELRDGIAADGSSMASLYVTSLEVREADGELCVRLGSPAVEPLRTAVPGRLAHERSLALEADDGTTVRFDPGDSCGWQREGDLTVITLSLNAVAELLDALGARAAEHRLPSLPGVTFEIV